jgi:hypothetical protein
VPEVVRRKACRGELPVSLQERVEILVFLASSSDEEEQNSALQTLQSCPPEEVQQVLEYPTTPVEVLDFVATNLAPNREELGAALLRNPRLTEHVRGWLKDALSLIDEAKTSEISEAPGPLPSEVLNPDDGPEAVAPRPSQEANLDGAPEAPTPRPSQEESPDALPEPQKPKPVTAIQRTQRMSVVQKVKAALTGTKEERMILVRDSNKLVARAVMQSPKLTEDEVEKYASMKDVCEDALRVLTLNRRFMKLYVVVKALVNNPRTPIDVGLHLLPRVNEFDLKRVAFNRNVADVIRHSAEKIVQRKEEARKPRFQGSKI